MNSVSLVSNVGLRLSMPTSEGPLATRSSVATDPRVAVDGVARSREEIFWGVPKKTVYSGSAATAAAKSPTTSAAIRRLLKRRRAMQTTRSKNHADAARRARPLAERKRERAKSRFLGHERS